jgi:hypothetical protein
MENELELTDSRKAELINAAFDAAQVRFNDRATALAAFKEGREIIFEDGQPYTRFDSEYLPLSDALLRFGYDRHELVDGRTLPRTGAGAARPGLASKADFPTVKDKVDFINKNGEDAWARLPLTGVAGTEVKTIADWKRLPLSEKVRRVNADPDAVRKLAPTPTVRQHGAFINTEALERQKAIRPASR